MFWHAGTKSEHPQLDMNVSQLTITKHILYYLFTLTGLIQMGNPSKSSLLRCLLCGLQRVTSPQQIGLVSETKSVKMGFPVDRMRRFATVTTRGLPC